LFGFGEGGGSWNSPFEAEGFATEVGIMVKRKKKKTIFYINGI
jgi:hypothetical protein